VGPAVGSLRSIIVPTRCQSCYTPCPLPFHVQVTPLRLLGHHVQVMVLLKHHVQVTPVAGVTWTFHVQVTPATGVTWTWCPSNPIGVTCVQVTPLGLLGHHVQVTPVSCWGYLDIPSNLIGHHIQVTPLAGVTWTWKGRGQGGNLGLLEHGVQPHWLYL